MQVRCIFRGPWRCIYTQALDTGPAYGTEWTVTHVDEIQDKTYYTLAGWSASTWSPEVFLSTHFVPITKEPDISVFTDLLRTVKISEPELV